MCWTLKYSERAAFSLVWLGVKLTGVGVSGTEEHSLGKMVDGLRCLGEDFMLKEMEHRRIEAQSDLTECSGQLYIEGG